VVPSASVMAALRHASASEPSMPLVAIGATLAPTATNIRPPTCVLKVIERLSSSAGRRGRLAGAFRSRLRSRLHAVRGSGVNSSAPFVLRISRWWGSLRSIHPTSPVVNSLSRPGYAGMAVPAHAPEDMPTASVEMAPGTLPSAPFAPLRGVPPAERWTGSEISA